MKFGFFGTVCVSASMATALVMAQPPEGGPRGPGRPGGGRPVPPWIQALDTDKDGQISASELEKATEALKTLDKNKDGVLTMDELAPPRDFGGFGGGRGPRGEGRPGEGGPRGEGRGFGGGFAEMLKQFDKDGDGKLSKDEAPERMKENFDRFDSNNDGFIDEADMRQMMERFRQGRPGGPGGPGMSLEQRMKEMDKDGDGKISKDEAPERMKESFDRLDTNNDGFIDEAEMRQMMERFREGRSGGPGGPRGGNN